jgi:hypothetical protein
MSNTTNKRKIITAIALFTLLVGLPGISWMYMKKGFNWRKEAISEFGNYGKIPAANLIWPDGTKENRLDQKVTVVHLFGKDPDLTEANKSIINTCEELFKQFHETHMFRLAVVSDGGTAEFKSYMQTHPSNIDHMTWVWVNGGMEKWGGLVQNGYEMYQKAAGENNAKHYFALADTSGTIRRYYDALDPEEVKRMVQQIAVLLPVVDEKVKKD